MTSFASPTCSCAYANSTAAIAPGRAGPQPKQDKPPEKPTQRARVSLFFDGTMNNKYNVLARKSQLRAGQNGPSIKLPDKVVKADKSDKASYENDYSNVARMFDGSVSTQAYNGKSYDKHFPIYIEGIGTSGQGTETDSTYGGITGMGDTGIPKKVEQGLKEALRKLRNLPKGKVIEFLHIDVFGFSRGAAAARHAMAMAAGSIDLGIRINLVLAGYTVQEIRFRFAGLYDTVASYGVAHWNDTFELGLNAVGNADQVIQLAAAEEHRANFRLTDISSAGGKDSLELFLPGVHSDIGGGYIPGAKENLVLWQETKTRFLSQTGAEARAQAQYDWFAKLGWFSAPGASLRRMSFTMGPTRTHAVLGARTIASNEYSYIPLNMMVDFAKEQGLIFANVPKSGDPVLARAAAQLGRYKDMQRKFRRAGNGGASMPEDWFEVSLPWLNELRGKYFHFSSYFMDLDAESGFGTTASDVVGAMAPQFEGTQRKRRIQSG